MPWPKDHKRQTRERIVEAAAAAFREHGIADVGVADIMRRAGLTHGGFYAHFESKDDLLFAALNQASIQANSMLDRLKNDDASKDRLLNAALAYLSEAHMNHPERGCPIPTLGPELTRTNRKTQATFAAEIRRRLKKLHALAPEQLPPEARNCQVAGALACMIGGLIIARGLKETDGKEFLDRCRNFLRKALANPDTKTVPHKKIRSTKSSKI